MASFFDAFDREHNGEAAEQFLAWWATGRSTGTDPSGSLRQNEGPAVPDLQKHWLKFPDDGLFLIAFRGRFSSARACPKHGVSEGVQRHRGTI